MAAHYTAFISYSHRDRSWGDWLHRALESYRIPRQLIGTPGRDGPVPAKLFPVFRDREELPSSADLSMPIQAALRDSACLIVICSPHAARSRWVNEEIRAFKQLGRGDRILAIIVDGEPNASDAGDIDPALECFPAALRFDLQPDGTLGTLRTEPLAADARPVGDGRDSARLKIIAGVLGVAYDRLKQRELEAARHRARIAQSIAAAMIVLALAAFGGGALTWLSGKVAQDRLRAAQIAQSLAVLEKAQDAPPAVAVPALLAALPRSLAQQDRPFVPQAAAQLALILDQWTDLAQIVAQPQESVQSLRFAGNAPVLLVATGRFPGTVAAYSVPRGTALWRSHFDEGVMAADISDDGARVAVASPVSGAPLRIYHAGPGAEDAPSQYWLPVPPDVSSFVPDYVQAEDGSVIAQYAPAGKQAFAALDPAGGAVLDAQTEPCASFSAATWLDPAGRFAVVWCGDGRLAAWQLGRKLHRAGELASVSAQSKPLYPVTAALSRDASLLAVDAAGDGNISFHAMTGGALLGHAALADPRPAGFAFAGAASELLVVHGNGSWESLTPQGPGHRFTRPVAPGRFETVLRGLLSADGNTLALALSSNAIETWAWRQDRLLQRLEPAAPVRLTAIGLDREGSGLLTGQSDGTVAWRGITDLALKGHWSTGAASVNGITAGAGDGFVLLSTNDQRLCLLDLAKPAPPECRQRTSPGKVLRLRGNGALLMRDPAKGGLTVITADAASHSLGIPADTVPQQIRFDHAGRSLAIAATDPATRISLLDLASGAVRMRSSPIGKPLVQGLAFDHSDRWLAAYGQWGAMVFDVTRGGDPVWKTDDTSIIAVSFTADAMLVGHLRDATDAYALDTWQPSPRATLGNGPGAVIATDRAGHTLLTRLSSPQGFAVVPAGAGHWTTAFSTPLFVGAQADLSPDGSVVAFLGASTDTTSISLRAARDVSAAATLAALTTAGPVVAARFTPDGARLVTTNAQGTVIVTDVAGSAPPVSAACDCGTVNGLFVDDAGQHALVAGEDAAVVFALPGLDAPRHIAVSGPAGSYPAADGSLRFLVREAKPVSKIYTLADPTAAPREIGNPLDMSSLNPWSELFLSGDGKRLAWLQNAAIHWLDPTAATPQVTDLPLGVQPLSGAMDRTGHALAVWLPTNELRMIDLGTAQQRFARAGIGNVQFVKFAGPDDSLLLLHSFDGATRVLDAGSGSDFGFLALPTGKPVLTDVVAPDGPDRVVGLLQGTGGIGKQGHAMLWSVARATPSSPPELLLLQTIALDRPDLGIRMLNGPDPQIGLVASADGKRGFLFQEGHLAALLALDPPGWQRLIDTACARAGRKLTIQELAVFHLDRAAPSRAERWLTALPLPLARSLLPGSARASCEAAP